MSTISVNVSAADKELFTLICANMGMTISTAVNIFIKTVNRTKKIPFEIAMKKKEAAPKTRKVQSVVPKKIGRP